MPILDGRAPAAIAEAAQMLAAGELVAFPTETVYGLGARADDDAAVAKVFAAKGRPADHPLIVHVIDEAAAECFASELSPLARRLIAAFWPGPLTVIVPRLDGMARAAAGGQGSVGLRCPSHPVARALLQAAAERGVRGVAAPSANRYGRISPTRALHVVAEFDESLPVLDGGDCEVGIESTIVDCSRGQPVLLRPGVLARERIEAAARAPLLEADADAPRASGTLASHYAPRATLRLMPAAALRTALEVLPLDALPQGGGAGLALYCRSVVVPRQAQRLVHHRMPDDPVAAAHELFAVLRGFDDRGVRLIWVEAPPADPAWEGVADRLQRAAARG